MARFQRTGEAEAFEQIVSRFLGPAAGVARQVLPDHALVEDAVQEAFLRIIRKPNRYMPGRPFASWFYAVLRNVCRDMLRRRARQARLVQEVADRRPAAEHQAGDSAGALELLARLPRGERAVLTLRIVHEMAFRDVAAALGISEEAAKKRAQRGLRRLRARQQAMAARRAGAVPASAEGPTEDALV